MTSVLSDLGICLEYIIIPVCLLRWLEIGWKESNQRLRVLLICFASFIFACGMTHLMNAIEMWWPLYWLGNAIKVGCLLAGGFTIWCIRYLRK